VLVDDLDGAVHRRYGGMADPVYLIDAEGRVAFYGMWTHGPSLQRAIAELLERGGVGAPVGERDGVDQTPHLAHALVAGWHALPRGGRRAILDLELAAPTSAALIFLGHLARPLLAPLALRATPLPGRTRALVGGVLGAAAGVGAVAARRRGSSTTPDSARLPSVDRRPAAKGGTGERDVRLPGQGGARHRRQQGDRPGDRRGVR